MIVFKPLYTFLEAADLLKICEGELRALIAESQLGYVLVAEKPLVRGVDLERYIDGLTSL